MKSMTIRYDNEYDNEIYVPLEINGVHTRSSYQKLNIPHRKTNVGQKALSYIGSSLWNNLNKALKISTSLNPFEHNTKQHYFNELKKKNLNNRCCTFDVSKQVYLFEFNYLYVLLEKLTFVISILSKTYVLLFL